MGLITVEGIISFPALFKAKEYKGAVRYGCQILVKKTDPQIKMIEAEIETVKAAKWPKGMPPNGTVYFLRDYKDDANYKTVVAYRPEDKGKPVVVDSGHNEVINPNEVVAGKMGKMSCGLYAYEGGVTAGLEGVLLLDSTGDLGILGSAPPSKEDMFGKLNASSPASSNEPSFPSGITMTAKANGKTAEQLRANDARWTDEMLVKQGFAIYN